MLLYSKCRWPRVWGRAFFPPFSLLSSHFLLSLLSHTIMYILDAPICYSGWWWRCPFMCFYLALAAWCLRWSTWRDSTSSEIYVIAVVFATWSPPSVHLGLGLFRWHQAADRHPLPSHLPEDIQKRNCPRTEETEAQQWQRINLLSAYKKDHLTSNPHLE